MPFTSTQAYIDLLENGGMSKNRRSAYEALAKHGACTAKELAELSPSAGGLCLWKRLGELELMELVDVVEERNCKVALKAEGKQRLARVYAVNGKTDAKPLPKVKKALDAKAALGALTALLDKHPLTEAQHQAIYQHVDWLTRRAESRATAKERIEGEEAAMHDLGKPAAVVEDLVDTYVPMLTAEEIAL